ncbi:hypothetical protein TCAL_16538 [Tigriopus californicus]|uniref:Uncharacterized protein n=1 Tax=Tigriopus californicus TaxID=6832 RepID=A0A553NT14_TIGCA|nr:hypothetical protein TCAL_16538 [Tigriopus californicus]
MPTAVNFLVSNQIQVFAFRIKLARNGTRWKKSKKCERTEDLTLLNPEADGLQGTDDISPQLKHRSNTPQLKH